MSIWQLAVLFGIPSSITGFLIIRLQVRMDARAADQAAENKATEKWRALLFNSLCATMNLGEKTALAVKEGKSNGALSKAMEQSHCACDEMQEYLKERGLETFRY